MKTLVRILVIFALVVGAWGGVGHREVQAVEQVNFPSFSVLSADIERRNAADAKLNSEYGQKVDLNNANVRLFRDYRGFYPTLARKIVNNAPYNKVEDVLEIPGLSEGQKERLQANLDKFTVTPTADVFNAGGDRYNPGLY